MFHEAPGPRTGGARRGVFPEARIPWPSPLTLFSPEEANALLPFLEPRISLLVAKKRDLDQAQNELELMRLFQQTGATSANPDLALLETREQPGERAGRGARRGRVRGPRQGLRGEGSRARARRLLLAQGRSHRVPVLAARRAPRGALALAVGRVCVAQADPADRRTADARIRIPPREGEQSMATETPTTPQRDSWLTTQLDHYVNWGRKNALWPMPFGTACCAIEFMAVVVLALRHRRASAPRCCASRRARPTSCSWPAPSSTRWAPS